MFHKDYAVLGRANLYWISVFQPLGFVPERCQIWTMTAERKGCGAGRQTITAIPQQNINAAAK